MLHIGKPLQIPELNLTPDPTGGVKLTEDMQQTLALLTGFWRNTRVLLKASPSGILFVTPPQLKAIYHVVADDNDFPYQGIDAPCSTVGVIAHPDNVGRIWVNPHKVVAADNGWPLDKADPFGMGLTNLNMLHILIEKKDDTAIIAYTL